MSPDRRSSAINPWIGATERRHQFWRRLTPPQLFVGSFGLLIVAGTLGLLLLPGLYTGPRLDLLDALFTATSAVCVTGLIVVDTATFFTPFGQFYLLLLIQLGGLGMITFTTLIILALGRRMSFRSEDVTRGDFDIAPDVRPDRLTRDVVRYTLFFELLGAVLLWALWVPRFGWTDAVWPAVFHAVSAFCNAGFSIFSDSLMGSQREPAILFVIMGLVIAGGLGFLTMSELALARKAGSSRRTYRLSVHSRLAIGASATLILIGWVAFSLFEWAHVLDAMAVRDRLVNALFMSVTPRTAGFNTIDYSQATESSNFLTILLMFIGGSPGSTAGGIKTTTFALLFLLAFSRFRGREIVDVAGRSIPEDTIQRAVGLALTAFGIVTLAIFVFTFTEGATFSGAATTHYDGFLPRMFESASALNTVGLSMGVTPTLSTAGKVVTTLLMFVGRVGPLTFAAALAIAASRGRQVYRYAYEDVVVG